MIIEYLQHVNETYGSGSTQATVEQINEDEVRIEFPTGEPGVYMKKAVREYINTTDETLARETGETNSVIVFDERFRQLEQ